MKRSAKAIQRCAEWLAHCIRIGWSHDDLDTLEEIWWRYHDEHGRLLRNACT
jgi:hypothetical protein